MVRPTRRRLPRMLLVPALASPWFLAAATMAQTAADAAPPDVRTVASPYPVALSYFAMLVLAAAVIVVSLVPSKRSHQD